MSRSGFVAFALAIILALPRGDCSANASEPPLTIIDRTSGTMRSLFLNDLERYQVTYLDTSTPWTDARTRFEGVLLRDILPSVVGGSNGAIIVMAHNDYFAKLPVQDLAEHDILLAWRADGRRLTLRDKGPFWVIYPLDSLGSEASKHLHKMVWQVRSIEIVR